MLSHSLALILPLLSVASGAAVPVERRAAVPLEPRAAAPTSIPQVVATLEKIYGNSTSQSTSLSAISSVYSANGLSNGIIPLSTVPDSPSPPGVDSYTNTNPRNPSPAVYPKKSSSDAPYSLSESTLRGAIYIPSGYQYGAGSKIPLICIPGTGSYGSDVYYYTNFAKHLSDTSQLDPVWLNIPHHLWDNTEVNAEYVAYALNYIHGISANKNVSALAWSQGGPISQWAFKYWPSTRAITSDLIAVSPDYHGTVEANLAGLLLLAPPSLNQQAYTSRFITTLRANGGDSAYVPTTNIYSGLGDEVVEPQQGTGASAYLNDARKVGVSNTEVQLICPGLPAGSFVTHEGLLYNPLTFALIEDAVTHAGPGLTSRLNLASLCPLYAASVFSLQDVLAFEEILGFAAATFVSYSGVRYALGTEPATASYA